MVVASLVQGILTVCIPFVADFGWEYVFGMRLFQGAAQGFINPCIFTLLAKWLPPCDRGFISIISGGGIVGTIVTMTLSGIIASSPVGWPGIFYFTGGLSIVWAFFVIWFCSNTPAQHPSISAEEKDFIELMPGSSSVGLPIPWRQIFRSKPFWAIMISQIVNTYGFNLMLSYIPSYIDAILVFDIKSVRIYVVESINVVRNFNLCCV